MNYTLESCWHSVIFQQLAKFMILRESRESYKTKFDFRNSHNHGKHWKGTNWRWQNFSCMFAKSRFYRIRIKYYISESKQINNYYASCIYIDLCIHKSIKYIQIHEVEGGTWYQSGEKSFREQNKLEIAIAKRKLLSLQST